MKRTEKSDVLILRMLVFPILRLIGTQHWIRLGIRYHILKAFATIPPNTSLPFEVDFFGQRYVGDLSSHIDWHIYFYGSYERHILLLLRAIARGIHDPTFIDVGANVGQHTMFMANESKQVHAFEPYEPVRAVLERNVRHLTNVSIHPVGLGTKDEDVSFFAPAGANLGVGSFVGDNGRSDIEAVGVLPVVHGDSYFTRAHIESADIFKIDVEGYERTVLEGLRRTIAEKRPVIVMEFSKETQASFSSENEFLSFFPPGYRAFKISSGSKSFGIFNKDGYSLYPFDFNYVRGNILLIPEQRLSLL